MESNYHITRAQLFFVVVQTQIGIGILSLPHDLHKVAKGDSWISIIIAGLGVQLSIFILYFICKRFPDLNFYEFTPKIVGKWIGGVINSIYVIYFIFIIGLITVLWTSILKEWVYYQTPKWMFYLIVAFILLYFASQTLRVIARFDMFVSVFLVVLIGLIVYSFGDVDFRYLLPIGQSGLKNIISGANQALVAMLGFDVLLFVFPLVKAESRQILKTMTYANIFVTSYYLFVILVALVTFAPEELNKIPEPVLYMLKALALTVIERVDLLFLSIWIVSVATSITSYGYLASKGLSYFFRKPHNRMISFVAVSVFIIAFIPQNPSHIDLYSQIMSYISYLYVMIIPFTLLIIAIIKKKLGESSK